LPQDPKNAFLVAMEQSHGCRLRRFLSARVRNAAADTPDLMQEIYLRLLRLNDHDAVRNPQAYLFTIANHVLHQHTLRASGALDAVALMDVAPWLQATPETDPVAQIEMEQDIQELERSLLELSPKAHLTLILSRCEGMTLAQIGARLGVSRAMAAKYLAKALRHVRQRLVEMNDE
jgi:RNA polymerase sigma-70 factor (ECF subfamily)